MISNLQKLRDTMRANEMIRAAYSEYLNYRPRFLTAEMVKALAKDCQVSEEEAFLSLFAASVGLDTEQPLHRALERNYLRPGVRRLDPAVYRADPYLQTIRFPNKKTGRWEMRQEFYAPFEPFVCNDPVLTSDFREISQLGYFTEEFRFPAILENGVEWMTVTPNEIETMRAPIAHSRGKVLTLGLGLGYFAFCASMKDEVESVTVAERDPEVISLFQKELLPQFPHAQKIRIVRTDAFAYLKDRAPSERFDSVFADLWHDPSDGLSMYLRLRRIEKEMGITNMDYWIEPSLLSALRWMVFQKLSDPTSPLRLQNVSPQELLSNDYLRRLAADIKQIK